MDSGDLDIKVLEDITLRFSVIFFNCRSDSSYSLGEWGRHYAAPIIHFITENILFLYIAYVLNARRGRERSSSYFITSGYSDSNSLFALLWSN